MAQDEQPNLGLRLFKVTGCDTTTWVVARSGCAALHVGGLDHADDAAVTDVDGWARRLDGYTAATREAGVVSLVQLGNHLTWGPRQPARDRGVTTTPA